MTQTHIHRVEKKYKIEKKEWKQARIRKKSVEIKARHGAVCVGGPRASSLCCWPQLGFARPWPSLTVTSGASLALSIVVIPTSKTWKNFDLVLIVFLQFTLKYSVLKKITSLLICMWVCKSSQFAGVDPLPLPYDSQGSNLGHQAWWQGLSLVTHFAVP